MCHSILSNARKSFTLLGESLSDQLFMLTGSGMMIRMPATQTKETLGKVTKGTRIMELRGADKKSHVDEIIFVARLPAELIDGDEEDSDGESEEE